MSWDQTDLGKEDTSRKGRLRKRGVRDYIIRRHGYHLEARQQRNYTKDTPEKLSHFWPRSCKSSFPRPEASVSPVDLQIYRAKPVPVSGRCTKKTQAVFNKSSLAAIVDEYSLEAAGVDREVWYEEEQEDMDTSFTSAADSLPTPALLSHAQQLSSVLYEAELHEAILAEVELQQQKHQHDLNQAADWVRGDQQQHDQGDQLAEQVLGSSGSAQLQVWPNAIAPDRAPPSTPRATSACQNLGSLVDTALARYLKHVEEAQMQAALDEWELVPADPGQLCDDAPTPPSPPVPGTSSTTAQGLSTSTGSDGCSNKGRAHPSAPVPPDPPPAPVQYGIVQPFVGLRSWVKVPPGSNGRQVVQAAGSTAGGEDSSALSHATPAAPSLVESLLGRARAFMSPFAAAASYPFGYQHNS